MLSFGPRGQEFSQPGPTALGTIRDGNSRPNGAIVRPIEERSPRWGWRFLGARFPGPLALAGRTHGPLGRKSKKYGSLRFWCSPQTPLLVFAQNSTSCVLPKLPMNRITFFQNAGSCHQPLKTLKNQFHGLVRFSKLLVNSRSPATRVRSFAMDFRDSLAKSSCCGCFSRSS